MAWVCEANAPFDEVTAPSRYRPAKPPEHRTARPPEPRGEHRPAEPQLDPKAETAPRVLTRRVGALPAEKLPLILEVAPNADYALLDSGNGQNNIWRFVFGQANPGISEDTAHWIWTKDHDAHNDVFIRFVVQLGTTPPTSDATGRVASTDINGDGIVDVTDVSVQLRLLLLAQNMPADCAAFARSCWLSSQRSTRTLAATPTVMGRRT